MVPLTVNALIGIVRNYVTVELQTKHTGVKPQGPEERHGVTQVQLITTFFQ